VDDGHPTDFRSADLLSHFDLKATFYIPKQNPERAVMDETQIREISNHFELGGHTVHHKSLKQMDDQTAFSEIKNGKDWLEDVIGKYVTAFCYPQGKFNSRTPQLIRKAGFAGARTCMFNLTAFPRDPYLWGLSTHAYSHTVRIHFQHALLERNYQGALNFFRVSRLATNWTQHFLSVLNHVEENGGIAHLYFHSWEIEQTKQWDQLKETLRNASERKSFTRLTNGELFNLWPKKAGFYNAVQASEANSSRE
jgi:peptidoglycan/xylan/chitin deacetylase (PgdA/CDA1 family)